MQTPAPTPATARPTTATASTAASSSREYLHANPGSAGHATSVRRTTKGLLITVSGVACDNPALTNQQRLLAARLPTSGLAGDPVTQLTRANALLHDRRLGLGSPLADGACALLGVDGTVVAARGGAAEVWVRRDGRWQGLLTGPPLATEARPAWKQARQQRDRDHNGCWRAQRELLESADLWSCLPLGAAVQARLEQAATGGVDAVVVATASAQLAGGSCAVLDSHLRRLHASAKAARLRCPDYAVIEIAR